MYKIIFLVLIVLNFAFQLFLQILDNKQVGKPLPASVADIYSKEEYDRWRRYSNKKDRLFLISRIVFLGVAIVLYCTNFISFIYYLLPGNEIVKSIIFIAMMSLIDIVVDLPFEYIFNFKIEAEFGFNKITTKTFVLDQIKNLVLNTLFTVIIFMLVFGAYALIGNYFGIIAFVGIAVIMIALSSLSTVFSKIFNKFTPLPEGELRNNLTSMFEEAGFKLKDIYVMDASRRTTKANAYCGGIGKLKQIVLYDNLVNNYTDGEITAVFAHELAHFKNKDTTVLTLCNVLNFLPMMLMMSICMIFPSISASFGFSEPSILFAYYVAFGSLLGIVTSLIQIPFNYMSRAMERRADALAFEKGYGNELISALKKLCKDSLSDMNPHPTVVKLTYNHPPLHERIELVEAKKQK